MFTLDAPSQMPPAIYASVAAAVAREGLLTPRHGAAAVKAPDERAARDRELAGWLRAAAAGDHAAFERFYDATLGYAHSLARRMLRPADLEDLLADAYFQAWREAPRFDAERGSPVTWLLTLVRSRCLDLLRHQRASPEVETDDAVHDERPSPLPGPDELLHATESGTRLHAALAALSAHERWVLGLAYWRELTHREICEVTALPLGTVKSLILRAQAKLREQLHYS
jgi:RNA polymerase sigma-70 factor (ECF subfamily)